MTTFSSQMFPSGFCWSGFSLIRTGFRELPISPRSGETVSTRQRKLRFGIPFVSGRLVFLSVFWMLKTLSSHGWGHSESRRPVGGFTWEESWILAVWESLQKVNPTPLTAAFSLTSLITAVWNQSCKKKKFIFHVYVSSCPIPSRKAAGHRRNQREVVLDPTHGENASRVI